MPVPPPVTIATLSFSFMNSILLSYFEFSITIA
jgi:hypothetical protein